MQEAKGRHEHPRAAYLRSLAWLRSILLLVAMHVVGISILYLLFSRLPSLTSLNNKLAAAAAADGGGSDMAAQAAALQLALPRNFDELHAMRRTLELYRKHYAGEVRNREDNAGAGVMQGRQQWWQGSRGRPCDLLMVCTFLLQVLTLLVAAYWYLQTFMIPGRCVHASMSAPKHAAVNMPQDLLSSPQPELNFGTPLLPQHRNQHPCGLDVSFLVCLRRAGHRLQVLLCNCSNPHVYLPSSLVLPC